LLHLRTQPHLLLLLRALHGIKATPRGALSILHPCVPAMQCAHACLLKLCECDCVCMCDCECVCVCVCVCRTRTLRNNSHTVCMFTPFHMCTHSMG
jgi:hypothetical protein